MSHFHYTVHYPTRGLLKKARPVKAGSHDLYYHILNNLNAIQCICDECIIHTHAGKK